MAPEFFLANAIEPGLELLPANMNSPQAKALVLTICLQESKLLFRRQVGGPARSYAQFESGGGVRGVLTHPSSAAYAKAVCAALDVNPTQVACYTAIEFNDPLAANFARLLLWTLPEPLPEKDNPAGGWAQYISAWRPGIPHPETWNTYWAQAWLTVEAREAKLTEQANAVSVAAAATIFVDSLDTLEKEVNHVRL